MVVNMYIHVMGKLQVGRSNRRIRIMLENISELLLLTDFGRTLVGAFIFIMMVLIPAFTVMIPYYLSQINLNIKARK